MRISRCQLRVTCLAIGIVLPTAIPVAANAAPAESAVSLTTTFQIGKATSDALTLRFTARNTSPSSVNVLSWDLPQARQSGADPDCRPGWGSGPYRGRMVEICGADRRRLHPAFPRTEHTR